MTEDDLDELLIMNHYVQEKLDQFEIDKKYLKKKLLSEINKNRYFDNLTTHWFHYSRNREFDGNLKETFENNLNNLVKNYEKLSSDNF